MSNSYSDEFRAQAVLALKAAGYPKRGTLSQVATALNIPKHTLSRWAEIRPLPRRYQTQADLQTVMLGEIYRILGQLPDTRNKATYRELTATLTALVNGVRGFNAVPPTLIDCGPILQDIADHIKTLNWSARTFFEGLEIEMSKEVVKRANPKRIDPSSPERDHS